MGNELIDPKDTQNRGIAMLVYLTSLFTTIVGPLICWALKRDDSMLVDKAGKTYFNFFISYILYMGVLLGVMIGFSVFMVGGEKWASVGYIIMMSAVGLIILLGILMVVFKIVGAFRYMRGDVYMPPLSIRILKV